MGLHKIHRLVKSLISYFTVPKGDNDVRVVFDGTKCSLNDRIWSPIFGSPTVDSLLNMLEPGTWQADIDVAEQFYNYILDVQVQPFCSLDITPYIPIPTGIVYWLSWNCCVTGLHSSPHSCVKMQLLAEEIIQGDHSRSSNPFFCNNIRLNLPGMVHYDLQLPRVSKLNSTTGRISGDLSSYVDDTRTCAPSEQLCNQLTSQVGSLLCNLGIQDAARRCSPPSTRAGAWTGYIVHTDGGKVWVLCTQDEWNKAWGYVQSMQTILREQGGIFDFKTLEKQRGFLVYVSRIYPSLVPYLKGIHLTLDSWRPNRNKDSWKAQSIIASHTDLEMPLFTDHPTTVWVYVY